MLGRFALGSRASTGYSSAQRVSELQFHLPPDRRVLSLHRFHVRKGFAPPMAATGESLKRHVGHRWSHQKTFYWIFFREEACALGCAPRLAKRLVLEKFLLAALVERLEAELVETRLGGDPTLRRAVEVALQNQVRLVHFFERVRLLADRHGQRRHCGWPQNDDCI